MIASVNPIVGIILPLLLVQYVLAIFTLTRLALARLPIRYYVVWNIVVLLVVYVGSIVFLIYYYAHRKPIADKIILEENARAAAAQTDAAEERQEPDTAESDERPQENMDGKQETNLPDEEK